MLTRRKIFMCLMILSSRWLVLWSRLAASTSKQRIPPKSGNRTTTKIQNYRKETKEEMKKSDLNPFLRTLFYLHPIDVYIIDAEQKQDNKNTPRRMERDRFHILEWRIIAFSSHNKRLTVFKNDTFHPRSNPLIRNGKARNCEDEERI